MSFDFTQTEIPSVFLVQAEELRDERGFFSEIYRESTFAKLGIGPFIQQNVSVSKKDVIRGLHFQAEPMAVGKLVSCLHGLIWDVAVDIRPESPTYRKYVARLLYGGKSLWIPPGFAHGFCSLEEQSTVMYRQTQYYSKEHDRSVRWNDPALAIDWPCSTPILSAKDAKAPLLKEI